jgi:hypothetical protein
METNLEIAHRHLNDFLKEWTEERLQTMELKDYVSIKENCTFCYAVEQKTKPLGSIQANSEKFGIYKRLKPKDRPRKYHNDDVYSWRKVKGFDLSNSAKAFELVRNEIIAVREAAIHGRFENLDRKMIITGMFKWKVAYLYSGERLISIFDRGILERIGNAYNLKVSRTTPISAIQHAMMANKPADQSIYQFSNYLLQEFRIKEVKPQVGNNPNTIDLTNPDESTNRNTRQETDQRNVNNQYRKGSLPYLAEQKHNKLQEALRKLIMGKYGKNVHMEKDFVDLRVDLEDQTLLYEVKSAPYASECVEQALGQILRYAFRNQNSPCAKLFIVGQYPANKGDKQYIDYVKSIINIELEYMHVDL